MRPPGAWAKIPWSSEIPAALWRWPIASTQNTQWVRLSLLLRSIRFLVTLVITFCRYATDCNYSLAVHLSKTGPEFFGGFFTVWTYLPSRKTGFSFDRLAMFDALLGSGLTWLCGLVLPFPSLAGQVHQALRLVAVMSIFPPSTPSALLPLDHPSKAIGHSPAPSLHFLLCPYEPIHWPYAVIGSKCRFGQSIGSGRNTLCRAWPWPAWLHHSPGPCCGTLRMYGSCLGHHHNWHGRFWTLVDTPLGWWCLPGRIHTTRFDCC